uniref:RNA-directed DNA polymerase n=1 Tax=Spodoptera frugiperda TaxID=7108 RepID=A0A2H1WJL1_SPOFR
MTRAQKRKQTPPTHSLADNGSNYDWPDQPKVVETHITPKDSTELVFIERKKLDRIRKLKNINYESAAFCYIPDKKTIYIKCKDSPSQITPAEFVRELDMFCKHISINELYFIVTKTNDIFVRKLLQEIKHYASTSISRIDNKDDQKVILNDFHLLPTSGHAGIRRMLNNIKKYYFWPCLEKDDAQFVQRCDKCQRNKHSLPIKEPMVIKSTANYAFEKIYLDIVGPLNRDNNNYSYILTLQCELSKFVEAYPLTSKSTVEVAECFVNNLILRYGIPRAIATDRGTEFMSRTMNEVCKLLHINKINSTAYHHQSLGALENSHKHLVSFLRIQCDNHPEMWSKWLPYWCFSFNTSVHSETKFTPYE